MQQFKNVIVFDNIAMFPRERVRLSSLAEKVTWISRELPQEIANTGVNEQYCVLPIYDVLRLAPYLAEADAVITCWTSLNRETLDLAPHLKYVGLWTNLWRHRISPTDVTVRGIHVDYLPDYGTSVVSEYVFAGLLTLARRPQFHHQETRRGTWMYELLKTGRRRIQSPSEIEDWSLAGKNLGIVGLGRIGTRVASIAATFGMNVAYTSRVHKTSTEPNGVDYMPIEALCRWCDILTIHVPPDAVQVVNKDNLALMKDGAILVNTAAGGAVDQAALIAELRSGRLNALLDVYEGLPPRKELKDLSNVLFSYRAAWLTRESIELKGKLLLDRMESFLLGEEHEGCATREFAESTNPSE